jgi:acetone carboxylase gamma subunit
MQSGLWGGYPGATGYRHNIRMTDFFELVDARFPYPTRDGDPEQSELLRVQGQREFDQQTLTMPEQMREGDIYLSPMRGGSGVGDPLERDPQAVLADLQGGFLVERLARSVYGVVLSDAAVDLEATKFAHDAIRSERRERAVSVQDWFEHERERVVAHANPDAEHFIEPVQRMYAESMRLSSQWAEEFRRFWRLPDDFTFDIPTPTIDISQRLLAGRDPAELQRQPRTEVRDALPPIPAATSAMAVTEETLEALLDGSLPGSQVRQIQSGYKDPDRFFTYLRVLQRRWPFPEDRILLPFGLHLSLIELPDGRRVIKSDSGHVFGDYRENWKLGAVVRVRDTIEDMLEIYPEKMHPDPNWNELREYYDPVSMTLLDIEAVPPGYPIVHDFLPDLESFYSHWLGQPLD